MPEPTAYEKIMIEKQLKETIISKRDICVPLVKNLIFAAQAQALCCTKYSLDRIWKVIVKAGDMGHFTAHVIVYKDSNGLSGYDDVACGDAAADGKAALEDLLLTLYLDL